MSKITGFRSYDLRFPTSEELDGSDAMNPDPDYSAAYVVLETDTHTEGHGLTFTIGRGNEICVQAIKSLIAAGGGLGHRLDSRGYGALLAAYHRR